MKEKAVVKKSWFRRHPNLTLFFCLLIAWSLTLPFAWGRGDEELSGIALYLGIVGLLFLFSGEIWCIKAKRRSLWNMLYNLIPQVGVFIIMYLDNYDADMTNPNYSLLRNGPK